VDKQDKKGRTALHRTAYKGCGGVVEILVKVAKVADQDKAGRTALHHAANQGHDRVVEILVEAKADVDTRTRKSGLHCIMLPMKGVAEWSRSCSRLGWMWINLIQRVRLSGMFNLGLDRTGPMLGSVSVRSRSHLNDSDIGPVLGFSKTIGLVSVSVQEGWTDRSDQVWTDWTDVA